MDLETLAARVNELREERREADRELKTIMTAMASQQSAVLQRLNDHQIQDTQQFGEATKERAVLMSNMEDVRKSIGANTTRIQGVRKQVEKIRWAKWAGYMGGGGGIGAFILQFIDKFR